MDMDHLIGKLPPTHVAVSNLPSPAGRPSLTANISNPPRAHVEGNEGSDEEYDVGDEEYEVEVEYEEEEEPEEYEEEQPEDDQEEEEEEEGEETEEQEEHEEEEEEEEDNNSLSLIFTTESSTKVSS